MQDQPQRTEVLLLEVCTAARRYFVPRSHLALLSQASSEAPPACDERGRTPLVRELGPLLDPDDRGLPGRRHAMTVALRRRSVVLLVERVVALGAAAQVRPLGPLLGPSLARPWVIGVVLADDEPALVLDLRRIAADLVSHQPA